MNSYNSTEIVWPDAVDPTEADIQPLEFVIEGYAARGLVTVIGGSGGSGKSLLNQYLLQGRNSEILDVARGAYALYLTGADTSDNELNRRSHAIGRNEGLLGQELPENALPFVSDMNFFRTLLNKIKMVNADAIVFDTLADFHHGNLIEAKDANETMQAFRSLATQGNVAVIIITHTRKGSKIKTRYDVEDISDSRIFTTKADFVFALKSEYQNDQYNLIELQCLKNRSSKPIGNMRMIIKEDDVNSKLQIEKSEELFSYELEDQQKLRKREERKKQVVELKAEGLSLRDIESRTGIPKSTVSNLLNS